MKRVSPVPVPGAVVWSCSIEGRWHSYSPVDSACLEQAHQEALAGGGPRGKPLEMWVAVLGNTYEVDVINMIQRRRDDPTRRRTVRRVDPKTSIIHRPATVSTHPHPTLPSIKKAQGSDLRQSLIPSSFFSSDKRTILSNNTAHKNMNPPGAAAGRAVASKRQRNDDAHTNKPLAPLSTSPPSMIPISQASRAAINVDSDNDEKTKAPITRAHDHRDGDDNDLLSQYLSFVYKRGAKAGSMFPRQSAPEESQGEGDYSGFNIVCHVIDDANSAAILGRITNMLSKQPGTTTTAASQSVPSLLTSVRYYHRTGAVLLHRGLWPCETGDSCSARGSFHVILPSYHPPMPAQGFTIGNAASHQEYLSAHATPGAQATPRRCHLLPYSLKVNNDSQECLVVRANYGGGPSADKTVRNQPVIATHTSIVSLEVALFISELLRLLPPICRTPLAAIGRRLRPATRLWLLQLGRPRDQIGVFVTLPTSIAAAVGEQPRPSSVHHEMIQASEDVPLLKGARADTAAKTPQLAAGTCLDLSPACHVPLAKLLRLQQLTRLSIMAEAGAGCTAAKTMAGGDDLFFEPDTFSIYNSALTAIPPATAEDSNSSVLVPCTDATNTSSLSPEQHRKAQTMMLTGPALLLVDNDYDYIKPDDGAVWDPIIACGESGDPCDMSLYQHSIMHPVVTVCSTAGINFSYNRADIERFTRPLRTSNGNEIIMFSAVRYAMTLLHMTRVWAHICAVLDSEASEVEGAAISGAGALPVDVAVLCAIGCGAFKGSYGAAVPRLWGRALGLALCHLRPAGPGESLPAVKNEDDNAVIQADTIQLPADDLGPLVYGAKPDLQVRAAPAWIRQRRSKDKKGTVKGKTFFRYLKLVVISLPNFSDDDNYSPFCRGLMETIHAVSISRIGRQGLDQQMTRFRESGGSPGFGGPPLGDHVPPAVLTIEDASMLTIAHAVRCHGHRIMRAIRGYTVPQAPAPQPLRVAVLNPSDVQALRHGWIGMYWDGGHVALEELLAMSTSLLTQHVGLDKGLFIGSQRHWLVGV